MLHIITDLNDPLIELVKDDPVRPAIPLVTRVHKHAEIFVLLSASREPEAVTCVAYLADVPTTETELGKLGDQVAAFYTIWSYTAGAGRTLIQQAQQHLKKEKTSIKRFVTLSPKTEMAKRFHMKNGALTLQENTDTVNYEYQ
jgi:hypothetical protein